MLTSSAGSPAAPSDASRHVAMGDALFDEGSDTGVAAAADAYSRAIAAEPSCVGAWIGRSAAHNALGQWAAAAEDATAAIAVDGSHAEAFYNRANAQFNLGDWEAAVADATRAIDIVPDFHEALCCRGASWCFGEEWEKAAGDLTKAIAGRRSSPIAHCTRGVAHLHLGMWDKARRDLTEALDLTGGTYPEASKWLSLLNARVAEAHQRSEAAMNSMLASDDLAMGSGVGSGGKKKKKKGKGRKGKKGKKGKGKSGCSGGGTAAAAAAAAASSTAEACKTTQPGVAAGGGGSGDGVGSIGGAGVSSGDVRLKSDCVRAARTDREDAAAGAATGDGNAARHGDDVETKMDTREEAQRKYEAWLDLSLAHGGGAGGVVESTSSDPAALQVSRTAAAQNEGTIASTSTVGARNGAKGSLRPSKGVLGASSQVVVPGVLPSVQLVVPGVAKDASETTGGVKGGGRELGNGGKGGKGGTEEGVGTDDKDSDSPTKEELVESAVALMINRDKTVNQERRKTVNASLHTELQVRERPRCVTCEALL